MNSNEHQQPEQGALSPAVDDPRIVEALEQYLTAVEAGDKPNRQAFLARHAEIAGALDAKHLQRFKNEAQAAAHLHHTNIVPVYAVGVERGVHFYAMQLIAGQNLAAVIGDMRGRVAPAEPKDAVSESGVEPTGP